MWKSNRNFRKKIEERAPAMDNDIGLLGVRDYVVIL